VNQSQTLTRRRFLPLAGLLTANIISLLGSQLTVIAVPWFVLETTGSASQTGIAEFFTAMAVAIAALLGGSVVDRLGFKPSSVVSDLVSGLSIAMVPLFHSTIGLQYWQLLVFVFLGNLLSVPGNTSRSALIPDLAVSASIRFERISAIEQSASRAARLIGAPLAGVLIAVIGTANVLWIDAGTFIASALIVGLLVPRAGKRKEIAAKAGRSLFAGIRFIRRDSLILGLVLTVMVGNFVDGPFLGVVLPVYAKTIFHSSVDLGLIMGALLGGALAGGLIFAAVGHRLPRRLMFFLGMAVLGLSYWALSFLPPLYWFIVIELIVGVAVGPLNPIIYTIEYERVPQEMRGRVFGAIISGAYLAVPLGMLLAGFLVEWIGLRSTIITYGSIYLIVILSLLINPALKHMSGTSHS
jgi:MFS family permease